MVPILFVTYEIDITNEEIEKYEKSVSSNIILNSSFGICG